MKLQDIIDFRTKWATENPSLVGRRCLMPVSAENMKVLLLDEEFKTLVRSMTLPLVPTEGNPFERIQIFGVELKPV